MVDACIRIAGMPSARGGHHHLSGHFWDPGAFPALPPSGSTSLEDTASLSEIGRHVLSSTGTMIWPEGAELPHPAARPSAESWMSRPDP